MEFLELIGKKIFKKGFIWKIIQKCFASISPLAIIESDVF
jgi:hypothetical protein